MARNVQRKAFEFARDILGRVNETRADGEVADRYSQATVAILGRRPLAEFLLRDEPGGVLADEVPRALRDGSEGLTPR